MSAQVSCRVNHWPNGPSPRPGILSSTGWWTEVWMTKRFSPFVIIRSAVDFSVSGEKAQALR